MISDHPEKTIHTEAVIRDLQPKPFGLLGKIWVVLLVVVCIIGLYAYVKQLKEGLIVTGMRDNTIWGIYISNFIFFVAISLVGSLISAILKLSNASWRTPLTRIAEMIAVSAIIFGGISIVVDMGRPDRMWNLIAHARIQSPITWDVIVIATYVVISILLLYIPLIPDFALLRDHSDASPRMKNWYRRLALGWNGNKAQQAVLSRCLKILVICIIPVALGIRTVTSFLFATTLRPGWDSTNLGPYFVAGAFMVGAASVIVMMYVIFKTRNLGKYLTPVHFDQMSKFLVFLSLVYLYFNINEYFVPAYKMKGNDVVHLMELFSGSFAPMFWAVQIGGLLIPIIVLTFKKGRKPLPAAMISIVVVVAAWFKRYLFVVPTLAHPYLPIEPSLPETFHHYMVTFDEWAITAFTLAGSLLVITILVRFLPVIPIVDTLAEMKNKESDSEPSAANTESIQVES